MSFEQLINEAVRFRSAEKFNIKLLKDTIYNNTYNTLSYIHLQEFQNFPQSVWTLTAGYYA